jgi:hypothetical protein
MGLSRVPVMKMGRTRRRWYLFEERVEGFKENGFHARHRLREFD